MTELLRAERKKTAQNVRDIYNKIPEYMLYSKLQSNQVMENGSINDFITNFIFKETEVPDILIIAQLLDDHTI